MALYGKLETDVEIRASAEKFHEIIHQRPHHMSNICSDKIQGVELHAGEWGKVGTILYWRYVHDGKNCVVKSVIEEVDEKNNSFTWKVLEGDLLKGYKSFRIKIQSIPKEKGSVIHCGLEYEKLHKGIPDSHTFLQLCVDVAKDIDAYLMGDNNEGSFITKA
ncbi:MLP-like protein 43 isoform X1 [Cucurbita pepo subsp. pepo]|uniref:MLP-like protein 43 n=1 Tax=Cucurbita pepo subsp. pepo TaxID=3664 RepID=UPI000C9D5561|nr:MLP-like protein 43 [Cucurbita pepo subsp. pepo]XP_023526171.1 MLP-like protein 43 isoform X1 [Cucurbita pepo subsp. pepo]